MVSTLDAAFADLFPAIAALELLSFLDPQTGAAGATASAQQAPLLDSVAEPTLAAAAGVLFVAAVAFMYRRAAAPVAGPGNSRRLSGLVMFMLCVSAGTLEYVLFAQGGGALGLAALRALPAAATAAFFWGMMLVLVAHVRAGGEGGGGGGGGGAVQGPVLVLTEVAVGAAAALVCMMALAVYGAKY